GLFLLALPRFLDERQRIGRYVLNRLYGDMKAMIAVFGSIGTQTGSASDAGRGLPWREPPGAFESAPGRQLGRLRRAEGEGAMSQEIFKASFIIGHDDFEHAARAAGHREQPRRRSCSATGHGQDTAKAGGVECGDQSAVLGIHLIVVTTVARRR